jgi:hypothetical protein
LVGKTGEISEKTWVKVTGEDKEWLAKGPPSTPANQLYLQGRYQ